MKRKEDQTSYKIWNEMYQWFSSLVWAIVIFSFITITVFRFVAVNGSSMESTLMDGERLLSSNVFYTPKSGDIIIFTVDGLRFSGYSDRNYPLVKRIIAVEGEEVELDFDEGTVKVNGQLLDEPYASPMHNSEDMQQQTKFIVPENTVFVMGDNREVSMDSRSSVVGFVDTRSIIGHVLLRFSPLNKFGFVK